MFKELRELLEKRSLNRYMDRLVPAMYERYRSYAPYTEAQVHAAIDELRLGDRYVEFAIAVLCKTKEENPFQTKELVKLRGYRNLGSGGGACGACGSGGSSAEGGCGGGGE